MNKSLPDALNLKNVPSLSSMRVDTEIIEPLLNTSESGSTIRFVLQKKAILDVNSIISLGVKRTSDGVGLFLPVNTGITSTISKCRMKLGNSVIQSHSDFTYLASYLNKYKSQEERSLKDTIKMGILDTIRPSTQTDGKLIIKDGLFRNKAEDGAVSIEVPDELKMTDNDDTTAIYSIRLSTLFSMLKSFALPLYLINEPLIIELDLKQQADGADNLGIVACSNNATNSSISYSLKNTLMLVDYLSFNSDMMEAVAKKVMSEQGLNVMFEDILLYNSQVAAVTTPSGTNVSSQVDNTELGLSGRLVNWICLMERSATANANNDLLGRYDAISHPIPESINMRINDLPYLPRPVTRESEKYTYASQMYSTPLSVHNSMYSQDLLTNKLDAANNVGSTANNPINNNLFDNTIKFENKNHTLLQGNYVSFDMTTDRFSRKPMQIGKKPVLFERTLTRTAQDAGALEQRFFVSVVRNLNIKNGVVSVSA